MSPAISATAARLLKRALALNPNLAMAWFFSGWANVWYGEPELALTQLAHAMRLSPHDPQIAKCRPGPPAAHFFAGRDAEAIAWAKASLRTQPDDRIGTCILAASHASHGEIAEAKDVMERLRRIDPALRISNLLESFPIRRPRGPGRLDGRPAPRRPARMTAAGRHRPRARRAALIFNPDSFT